MQSIEQEIRAASPSVRESVQTKLMPLYEKEKGALAQAHEAYKDGLIQDRALELKHHEQKAAARASVDAARQAATAEETAREALRKSKLPDIKKDVEEGHVYNEQTGMWEVPKIAGADPTKPPTVKGSEFEKKTLINHDRAKIAVQGLLTTPKDSKETYDELLASSRVSAGLSALPMGVGRQFRSDDYKEAETHAENFVQAFIRQQSGAGRSEVEAEAEARSLIPKVGDTAIQLRDKREQRQAFIEGTYDALSPSGQRSSDFHARKREAERAKTTGPDPLENREILMPDKTIRVRRDGKWVPK
jgi:hypothetical protein